MERRIFKLRDELKSQYKAVQHAQARLPNTVITRALTSFLEQRAQGSRLEAEVIDFVHHRILRLADLVILRLTSYIFHEGTVVSEPANYGY
jgi:hypothetical protein